MSQKKSNPSGRSSKKNVGSGANNQSRSVASRAKRSGKTKLAKNSRQRQATNLKKPQTSRSLKPSARSAGNGSVAVKEGHSNKVKPIIQGEPAKEISNSLDKNNSGGNKQILPSKPYFVEVDVEHAGQRLDNFLMTHLKGVPKTHVYRIIRKGEVRINKGRVKQTTRLNKGDLIRIPPIRLSESITAGLEGAKYAFLNKAILLEDEGLIVLNKPSGMAVHAGSGIKVGLIEALRALRTDLKYLELVHRLDRETSGCLVLAKKSSVLKSLHEDFKNNSLKNPRLDKRYLCLVKGQWQGGQRRVTKPLNTQGKRGGERMVLIDNDGVYASSIIKPVEVFTQTSLMEVKLLTGRTHQVRVHSLSEGHPLAGDQKYGERAFNKEMKAIGLNRLFLHAALLTFHHPLKNTNVTIEAPLPEELKSVLGNLNQY